MTFRYDDYNYLVRLEKDEPLIESLTKFTENQSIKGAFLSGLGGAQWTELGFYDLEKRQYQWQTFTQLLEVTSLQGTISWQHNKPALHIHGTFSNREFQAFGGHIKELQVGGTLEVFLHTFFSNQPLTRTLDERTGLSLLAI